MYRIMEEGKLSPDSVFIRKVVYFDGARYSVLLFKGRVKQIALWHYHNLDELIKIAKKELPDTPFDKIHIEIISTYKGEQLYGNNIILRLRVRKTALP